MRVGGVKFVHCADNFASAFVYGDICYTKVYRWVFMLTEDLKTVVIHSASKIKQAEFMLNPL
ncbi:hypothetical protein GCM10027361_03740 [Erwinia aphidicola]